MVDGPDVAAHVFPPPCPVCDATTAAVYAAIGLPSAGRCRHVGCVLRLLRLMLTEFRNYPALTWHPGERISVLYGANGSGKTNLLEAVSLLVPGRGLRGARGADLPRQGGGGGWAVAGRFQTGEGEADIGTGAAATGERRVFRVDGARAAQPGGDWRSESRRCG